MQEATSSEEQQIQPIPAIDVCSLQELQQRKKKTIDILGRNIVLFYHKNQAYALDRRCYHTGGPLEQGDIELLVYKTSIHEFTFFTKDLEGITCINCPWHHYHISLKTGEGYYYNMQKQLKSKGLRQRTHKIDIKNGRVLVTLTKMAGGEEEIPSDHYCPGTDEEKKRMGLL